MSLVLNQALFTEREAYIRVRDAKQLTETPVAKQRVHTERSSSRSKQ